LAYLREWGDEVVLCVANLSRAAQPVEMDLSAYRERVPVELIGRSPFPPIGELPYFITLPGYGFYWFLLAQRAEAPSWHEPYAPPSPDLLTLVLPQGWGSLISSGPRKSFEDRIIPEHLVTRRWFAAKDETIVQTNVSPLAELPANQNSGLFLTAAVSLKAERQAQLYALPLAITWEDAEEEKLAAVRPHALAQVRQGSRLGLLHDAMAEDGFVRGLVANVRNNAEIDVGGDSRLVFAKTGAFPDDADLASLPVFRSAREQSNTSVQFGDQVVLKLYRRLQSGVHPEVEMGRFLIEETDFCNTPAMLGALTRFDADGTPTALAVLMQYVPNQGDAWTFVLDYLKRYFEEADLLSLNSLGEIGERHKPFLARMSTLGRRVGELHQALAGATKTRAFVPVPIGPRDMAKWRAQALRQANMALTVLRRAQRSLNGRDRDVVRRLLKKRSAISAQIKAMTPETVDCNKTRIHGDLHLGQVLVSEDDFVLIDFEGEPARPLAERRGKHSPLRDVAGMLRSFDYAAAFALRAHGEIRPESVMALRPLADDWRQRVKDAFMVGYGQAIAGSPSFPADEAVVAKLIDFFMLEKALYEVCYEAANRPDWIETPVSGVLELIEAGA
jgi:maltose alpha-D-glucosyltransferase/alpha-amylase